MVNRLVSIYLFLLFYRYMYSNMKSNLKEVVDKETMD